jgi:hypothetical protein
MIVEQQEELLAWERELESHEGTIIAWEESLMAFAHVLRGGAIVECDASHACVDAIWQDYSVHVSASSSWSKWLNALSWSLEERTALLCLQETDMKVHEVILAEGLEHGLCPPNGRDLPAELDEAHTHVRRTTDDIAAEAEWLSRQVMQVAGVLIDLGLLPIEDVPQLPKIAREVLSVVDLILKRLQEALAFGDGPWD